MHSPFRKFGHNVKSLFRGRSGDRRPNTDDPEAVDVATTASSAPPSTTAGLLPPIVVVTPTRSMFDVTENPIEQQDTRGYGLSPSAAHPSPHSSSHRSPSERPSLEAAPLGVQSQSSDNPLTDIALSDSRQQPVPQSPYPAQLPPTPLPHKDTLSPPPVPTPVAASTSFFSDARDFSVSNLNVNNSFLHSKSLFELLSPHISHGAAHDSNERCDAPACHEETRVAIRQDIVSWIKHGDEDDKPRAIMWLSGPAGAGKSAIAGSVADACKEEGLLAGSFFFSSFSGSADRCSKRGFIATLAHQISQHSALHLFETHLFAAINRHPDIFHKRLKEQSECLILGPFQMICDHGRAGWPKVIIVDGLDEVVAETDHDSTERQIRRTSENDQVEILSVLATMSHDPSFPFRIFVASRPESNITDFFTTDAQSAAVRLFLDSKYNPNADVERFLVSKFAQICRRSGISSPSWPGEDTVNHLVEMSSGQFIVPVTIVRWVESGLPRQQLDEVLNLADVSNKNPFATLDALYRHILKRAPNPRHDPHLVVNWILSIQSAALIPPDITFWRGFLEDEEGELNYCLAPLTSLISVPPPSDTSSPITIYHKSLTDFLSSPARCGDLYVEDAEHTSFLSERIFVVLKNKGPIVPLPSPPDLARFLNSFLFLGLLVGESAEVLTPLSESSKAELASCDVAWWTRASLSNLLSDGSSLSQDCHRTESSEDWGSHPWLVYLIYQNIHQAMGCGSEAPSLGQGAARQAQGSKCHAACVHWRTGILAKAKELGWCVHGLARVQLDELEHLDWDNVKNMFKEPGSHSCSLCKPASTWT